MLKIGILYVRAFKNDLGEVIIKLVSTKLSGQELTWTIGYKQMLLKHCHQTFKANSNKYKIKQK